MASLAPRLELRQAQSLVMTPQLQQSIKLLQLSTLDVLQFVAEEIEKNPLLSEALPELGEEGAGDAQEGGAASATDDDALQESALQAAPDTPESPDVMQDFAREFLQDAGRSPSKRLDFGEDDGFSATLVAPVSLRDHLQQQLWGEVSDPATRLLVVQLIDLIDEAGYITDETAGIARMLRCDESDIEAAFAVLHRFDPPGIGARSLAECLALQLRDRNRFDPAMATLLHHLDKVAYNDIIALSRLCGVSVTETREMCAELRTLNPRPGSLFEHEVTQAIIPDIFLRPTGGASGAQGWHIELNQAILPRVLVDKRYYVELTGRTRGKQERQYLSDQWVQANWLVKALDSRARTIVTVATEIVARQDRFLREGIRYLTPLTLKEVAAATGLHESTVSRVTNHKFIHTPCGTFELKYFFGAGLPGALGDSFYASKTVQHMIKELITQERPDAVLSDDAIAVALGARGVDVARRTVAKYRELLHLPPSAARRRQKR